MRSKRALLNVISTLLFQLITIICGFIVPRLIIGTYGSGVNGVITSISQFLGYIILLESGIGGVVKAALYKPLAIMDKESISSIIKATEKFFRYVALAFIGYSFVLAGIFPLLVKYDFGWFYVFSLVLIIGFSTFGQYYFGVTYQILLQADQKNYVISLLRLGTTIVNTIIIVVLVKFGVGIHLVKLGSSLVFIIRPLVLNYYVKKKYQLIHNCKPNNDAVKQRWDGLGHHLAYFLHRRADVIVLTIFANIKEVSVYSVYNLVVLGIENITVTLSSGFEAAFGNMIAKEEMGVLNKNFRIYEFISFSVTTTLFTSAALLILSFVTVYTRGISDVNYYRPMFAYVLILAEAIYCIRLPYFSVTMAAGHFKQTRNGAFIEAFFNIVLSVILVQQYGVVGVAIATLCAMLFRTFQYAIYLSNKVLHRSVWLFWGRCIVNITAAMITIYIAKLLPVTKIDSYFLWFLHACRITLIATAVTLPLNTVIYYQDAKSFIEVVKRLWIQKADKQDEKLQ
ncbi:MAG: polysaccharide biosynthesis C-terminal domain-containing protein [Firmicutes bacterium]|nr:polysaccharide biosynthesis C-terminal domain-containing protein [Bacillota bacterium]